ncbi:MAG: acetylglutamate kinase [Bacteroidia bacterium]
MRLTLLKIGGQVLETPAQRKQLLDDFARLPGQRLLIHGGGRAATDLAARLGVEAPLIEGRRITSREMLDIAVMVYGGLMNRQLVAALQARGCDALGLTGADLDVIRAHRRPAGAIDYGFVGDVDSVKADALRDLLDRSIVPVLAPLTHDGQGQLLNTNADTIASIAAVALAPLYEVHLVYTFERPGVLLDPADDSSLLRRLDPTAYARHRTSGAISGGMIPKLDNAFAALRAGVARVYICQAEAIGRLYSSDFSGTEILL